MSKVSIRQPLVIYAMVFVFLVAFVAVTISSFALVRGARRAYHRAVTAELKALVSKQGAAGVRHLIAASSIDAELELGVVTHRQDALGIDFRTAQRLARGIERDDLIAAVRLEAPGSEAYVVARIDPSVPMSIAFVEVSRMIPLVLVGAIAIAALLAFMIGRILLPSLDVLSQVAATTTVDEQDQLTHSETPNEILEVAQRFRRTVRQLNDERDRIEAQKDEMARMQESLVRASKLASVGRLAAGVAHEIGNPLAAVQGYLSLLKSGLEPDQERDVLERSHKELGRINETIRKLLTYARQGEQADEPTTPIDTTAVIAEAIGLVSGHPNLRGITFTTPDKLDTEDAKGHAGRLQQVLVNLLLNAGQAIGDSGHIEISRVESTENIDIRVTDDGPGITPDRAEQIFDPFFTTKAPGEGTGLGLAVSRALMEAMGGDLVLDAEHEGGARFVVRLERC